MTVTELQSTLPLDFFVKFWEFHLWSVCSHSFCREFSVRWPNVQRCPDPWPVHKLDPTSSVCQNWRHTSFRQNVEPLYWNGISACWLLRTGQHFYTCLMLPLTPRVREPFEDVLTIFWWDTFEFIYSMDKSVKVVEGTLTNDELVCLSDIWHRTWHGL